MLNFIEEILHGILSLPYLVINFFIAAINGFMLLVTYFVSAAIALLPNMGSPPSLPEEVLRAVAWFFPLGLLLPTVAGLITSYGLYLAVKVTLNWAKVNL